MTAVLGLDLSLTATGLAVLVDEPVVGTIRSNPFGDTPASRRRRIDDIVDRIHRRIGGSVDLVVVEGPSFGSRNGHAWDRAGLWWAVVAAFPVVVEVPPTVVKKFAAGKGNADKTAVAAGMTRLWPDVNPSNDNEFDALTLATMGAQHLGMDVPTRAHHADCLAKVLWSATPTDRQATR